MSDFYIISLTVLTTLSTVNPKCSNNVAAGPEAPKPSIAITFPSRPTYLYQPKSESASTATHILTAFGSTHSLYYCIK